MKKILIPFLFFIIILSSKGQENKLYLFAAHPFYDSEPFPSYLLVLNSLKNSLDTIQQISIKEETLRDIKYDPEQRKIMIIKDGGFYKENIPKVVKILNMNFPKNIDSINLGTLNYEIMNSWLFKMTAPSEKNILGVNLFNSNLEEKQMLLGVDINKLVVNKLELEIFKNTMVYGNPGSCLLTFDFLAAYTNPNNGELRIPESSDTSQRPIFPIALPKEFQPNKRLRKTILINTKKNFGFSLFNSPTSKEEIGFSELAILDKTSNSWFKQRIKGNYDGLIRSFDDWLAGTVYSSNIVFDEKGRIKEKIQRISPGKDKRRQKNSATGTPADYRFDYFGLYSPGIIYLLNTKTKNYIEWNTGQGDSEILLVENNEVYYRVSDEIFKAPILDGKNLGKPKLLFKDKIVPDIHWAFLSN